MVPSIITSWTRSISGIITSGTSMVTDFTGRISKISPSTSWTWVLTSVIVIVNTSMTWIFTITITLVKTHVQLVLGLILLILPVKSVTIDVPLVMMPLILLVQLVMILGTI
jgi:hypothetical protein